MKNKKTYKKYVKEMKKYEGKYSNDEYLSRHPEFKKFEMPKYFYFKFYPDRMQMHYAFIQKEEGVFNIYFIDVNGRIFDKLEFKNKKLAQRGLRKRKFYFSTNKFCEIMPDRPIFLKPSNGRKTAPYSKGNLWKKYNCIKAEPQKIKAEELYNLTDSNKPINRNGEISPFIAYSIIISFIGLIILVTFMFID